jgi:hypothetical protein
MIDDQLANEDQIVFGDLPVPVAQERLHGPKNIRPDRGTQVESAKYFIAGGFWRPCSWRFAALPEGHAAGALRWIVRL